MFLSALARGRCRDEVETLRRAEIWGLEQMTAYIEFFFGFPALGRRLLEAHLLPRQRSSLRLFHSSAEMKVS